MQMSAGFEQTRSEVEADLTSRRFSSPLCYGDQGFESVFLQRRVSCDEAFRFQRTRFEMIVERKLRRGSLSMMAT
jgi:hypothetical protein